MAGVQAIRIPRYAADVRAATAAAMALGKATVHEPTYATADSSGWCDTPIVIDEEGYGHWRGDSEPVVRAASGRQDGPARRLRRALRRKPEGHRERVWTSDVPDWEPARTLSRQVRCRRCDGCRRERRCMWAKRAVSEWRKAQAIGGRTWFVTLTFTPHWHHVLHTQARQRLQAAGSDLDGLSWEDRYSELLEEYHAEVDGFLNRLRGGIAARDWKRARIRYLVVPEPHKGDGIRVHYHALIHEAADPKCGLVPLTRRRIEQAWRGHASLRDQGTAAQRARARPDLGFVQAKLVESSQAAVYCTKYLGKHHYEGRLRVSKTYGAEGGSDDEAELRAPAGPPPPVRYARPAAPPDPIPEPALRAAAAALDQEDSGSDAVCIGENLGACPSGLHLASTGCDCQGEPGAADEPLAEFDERRGTPRRKWALRGWHEPRQRRKLAADGPSDGDNLH